MREDVRLNFRPARCDCGPLQLHGSGKQARGLCRQRIESGLEDGPSPLPPSVPWAKSNTRAQSKGDYLHDKLEFCAYIHNAEIRQVQSRISIQKPTSVTGAKSNTRAKSKGDRSGSGTYVHRTQSWDFRKPGVEVR